GFIQPRAVRVAERVPTDSTGPPGSNLTLSVDRQPSAIRCRMVLPTPNARSRAARRTRDHAASRRTKMPLLDLRGMIRTLRCRIGKDPAFLRRHGLLAPLQHDLRQGRMQRNIVLR